MTLNGVTKTRRRGDTEILQYFSPRLSASAFRGA
jgi:hypothetical protein